MISYEIYKITHLVSLLIFFCAFAIQLIGQKEIKTFKILSGASTLLILISGMGLLARVNAGGGFPTWAAFKTIIWLVLTIGLPIIAKRAPRLATPAFWASLILFALAAAIMSYRA